MDDSTRTEIEEIAWDALREAGIKEPPVQVEELTRFLRLDREFYDLELLWEDAPHIDWQAEAKEPE